MVNRFLMLGRREDGFQVLLSQKKILMSSVNQFCVNLQSVSLSLVFSMEELLRLRRPFVAYITDAIGNELFRVRRPFGWITSSICAEINSKEIGVVHRGWHLWRRVYDLYLENKLFAVVENLGFWICNNPR
ncbi:uncharacterized protein LOC116144612 [Pistacia vera]|uniref:uncharacterized protein LOC116144612 n=1 Tax=Pistacia vera TaxID=55513 RepID=UPI001263A70A|nr:uncharacterized protein LOC116144612 [Pistacia vera]